MLGDYKLGKDIKQLNTQKNYKLQKVLQRERTVQ